MTTFITLKDLTAVTSVQQLTAAMPRTIRFSLNDVLTNQAQIVAIWRLLLSQNLHPVAHTFLGKIVSISLQS